MTVFVPHYAMSGGTLIALAADEIVMAENAVLGPVDPQLGDVARRLDPQGHRAEADRADRGSTIIQADIAEKALRQVGEDGHGPHLRAEARRRGHEARPEAAGKWTHDYPITVTEARELGLPVSTDMPAVVFELMQLYPQTGTATTAGRVHRPAVRPARASQGRLERG